VGSSRWQGGEIARGERGAWMRARIHFNARQSNDFVGGVKKEVGKDNDSSKSDRLREIRIEAQRKGTQDKGELHTVQERGVPKTTKEGPQILC